MALLRHVVRDKLLFMTLIKKLVWYLVFLVRCLVRPWILLNSILQERLQCPAIKDPLLLIPARELAGMIRSRQVKCVQVVEAYINRVKDVNPLLNAVVQDRFEDALREAQEVDAFLTTDGLDKEELLKTKPLLGVPLTVKESIAVKGMSNNAGFSLLKSRVAEEDSYAVSKLKGAGAIPLLVSNTPELCKCWETYNSHTGRTNNPYDTRRTPGGSSGGEAALLGAGASVISVASDVSGSLRLPSMFTCVYGHKPTPGFVCNRGHWPSTSDPSWDTYFTVGPMCRYASDLPTLLKVIIGDEEKARVLRLDEKVDLSKVKVYYMEEDGPNPTFTDPVDKEIKQAMREAVTYLRSEYGMTVQKACIEDLEDVMHYTTFLLGRLSGLPNVFQKDEKTPEDWNSIIGTFLARALGRTKATLHALLYGLVRSLADCMPKSDRELLEQRNEKFKRQFKELLGDDGVFLYPTFPNPAHFHMEIYYKLLNTAYLSLFNLMEMPVTTCPLGLNSQGLPIGVQIGAWQKQDRLALAVALALEKRFGGWRPPCDTPSDSALANVKPT